ncbi:MAG: monofunctional biosynthetic peptidoglycan transglycosylase [Pseudomonadota bacterium]
MLFWWATTFVVFSVVWVQVYHFTNPTSTWLMRAEAARLGQIEAEWTGFDGIPVTLARSVMAAEDARFCEHWGIDFEAAQHAAKRYLSGQGRLLGGSTITQQVAKNVFLWPERSLFRKGLEFWFAVLIEISWSKRRIMEVYLNVAEFGPGAFGVDAATREHFGGRAAGLSHDQAARLAAVLPSPRRLDPAALDEAGLARAEQIRVGADDLAITGRAECVGG